MSKTLKDIMDGAEDVFSDDINYNTTNSKKIYEKALEVAKSENKLFETEYIKGKLSILDKKWQIALEHFNKVIEINDHYLNAYSARGYVLIALNKYKEALENYNKALEFDPEFYKIWYSKGITLTQMRKLEEALESYDKAIEINPEYDKAWNNRGITLFHMRKYKEALESYDKAIEINSKHYRVWYNRGNALAQMRKLEEALESYDKAIEINPEYDKAWNNRGNVLLRMRKYKEALESYDKAIEIKPNYDLALNNKGNVLFHLKKYEESIKYFDKALEINPKSETACANKGRSLSKLGKHGEAINCINKCLDINPKSSILKFRKNSILMNIKKFDEIQKEREKLYSEEKEDIRKSKLSKEEKDEKILEINIQEEIIKELKDDYRRILDAKNENEKKLAFSLEPRVKSIKDNFLLVLRRWNSFTPTIPTGTDSNLGGGYYIRWCGKGIVIDPGFDFLDNFFDNGLVIDDIDAVVITHAHIDHCVDFESLLTLIFEYNEKNDKKKKIDVFMNLGTIKKLLGWIPLDEKGDKAKIKYIYPLEKGVAYNPDGYNLKITATEAIHNEILSTKYSVGVILDLYGIGDYTLSKPFKIGYTGDTGHSSTIEKQYEDVDIIISHLGSVEEDDFNPAISDPEGNIADTEGNHLMLKGVISTIYKSKADLAIVSEFGEELGEHRLTIINALNRVFRRNKMTGCLTGDIGLKIKIPDIKVKCCYCSDANNEKYFKPGFIIEDKEPINKDKKAIVHFCKRCKRSHELLKRRSHELT